MTASSHSLPVRLAAAALQAAEARKFTTAARLVERIVEDCGGEGIQVALIAWIDTYLDHIGDGIPREPIRIAAWNGDTGALTTDLAAPHLPDHARWSAELAQARANRDEGRWRDLLADCTEDNFSTRITAVLEGAAATITSLPRGIARMGRPAG